MARIRRCPRGTKVIFRAAVRKRGITIRPKRAKAIPICVKQRKRA